MLIGYTISVSFVRDYLCLATYYPVARKLNSTRESTSSVIILIHSILLLLIWTFHSALLKILNVSIKLSAPPLIQKSNSN